MTRLLVLAVGLLGLIPIASLAQASATSPANSARPADDVEADFWRRIADSKQAADFDDYLAAFPQGRHASIAKLEARRLREATAARPTPAAPSAAAEDWGLTAEDLSIKAGDKLAEKAQLASRRGEILAAAEAGDMVAQYLIGASFTYGIGVAEDSKQAAEWMTKAADQGLLRAYAVLGAFRVMGYGTEQDDISGWALLLKASNAGNGFGRYQVAILTLRNGYKFIDRPTALRLLKQSAMEGVSAAQYALGHSYLETTDDQRKDRVQARYWLEKAAAQGIKEAAADLAAM